jgi:hypothetical protein
VTTALTVVMWVALAVGAGVIVVFLFSRRG